MMRLVRRLRSSSARTPRERVTAPDVVAAVAQHEQQPPGLQNPRREAQHVEGRGVRPVQVFDDDDERALGTEPLEQRGDHLIQAVDAGALVALGGGACRRSCARRAGRPPPAASTTASAPNAAARPRKTPASGT